MLKNTVIALAAIGLAVGLASAEEKIRTRGIIRAGVDSTGRVHGDLAKLTGLANATALSYKVLLQDDSGKEHFVDEKNYTFKVNDRFRIQIEADTDLYLYVFHQDPHGKRTVLVPDSEDRGRVPVVKQGDRKVIPDDGTYFQVTEPVGEERLLVFATQDKRPELTPQEAFQENTDTKKELQIKSTQDKVFSSTTEAGPKKTITQTDIKKVAQSNEELPEFRLRGLRWEPEEDEESKAENGKTVLQGSYDADKKPELFVEIPLRSKG